MSAPTSSPSFSTLICSILFTRSPKQKGRRARTTSTSAIAFLRARPSWTRACRRVRAGGVPAHDGRPKRQIGRRVSGRLPRTRARATCPVCRQRELSLPLYAAGARGRGARRSNRRSRAGFARRARALPFERELPPAQSSSGGGSEGARPGHGRSEPTALGGLDHEPEQRDDFIIAR